MNSITLHNVSRLFSAQFFNAMLVVSALTFGFVSVDASAAPKETKTQEVKTIVNINKASAEELAASLKGVGIKKAQAIVSWRDTHGKFKSIEQLAEVKGIGAATVEKNQSKMRL